MLEKRIRAHDERGGTPVTQTPDADLNQHVRRAYTTKESALFVEAMRSGVSVPSTKHTECIDLMADVLSDTALHLRAAEGYKKTGTTVALDGSQDEEIVRGAGNCSAVAECAPR